MNIDQAIKMLQYEKAHGTEAIVFAYWKAEAFGVKDNEAWESASNAGDEIDWSSSHEAIQEAIEEYASDADPLTPIDDIFAVNE